jgi:hypothetical protein
MNRKGFPIGAALAVGLLVLAGLTSAAFAQSGVSFKDPVGDDNGPGNYVYPTDLVYKKGSFDITSFDVEVKGKKAEVAVTVNSPLEDPWGMKVGFAVQMFFVFIDNQEGGFKEGPPGTNVVFAPGNEWDKLIILSPQPPGRVKSEVEGKMPAAQQAAVLIPLRIKGAGRTISATFDLEQLGEGDPSTWGWQVLAQSNEGFPEGKDLLTRKVNEYEGQHRFGGGSDYDCDPHVMDLLAGEEGGQAAMLKYECNEDGSAKAMATLKMVRK